RLFHQVSGRRWQMSVRMEEQEYVCGACGCPHIQLPGTARLRREEPNGHRFSGTCGRGFDQRLRVVCAAAIDNNDVVKAEPGGEEERHVNDAGFVQRGNDHRERHGEGRTARRCWLANTLPRLL